MGFFGTRGSANGGATYTNVLENLDAIEPKYENFDEAALASIVEAENNYNNIMQAIGIDEFTFLEENGYEMVYTESSASGFLGKVKEFFKNLYQKIKGLFQKFIALIDSYAKSDKDFVNKYRRQLLTVNTKDFEYKGFNFVKLAPNVGVAMDKAYGVTGLNKVGIGSTETLKAVEDETDIGEKMRGAAINAIGGPSGSLEAGEFSKELFILFRDGEESKISIDKVDVSGELSVILNYNETKKHAEKTFKELEKAINETLKGLDKTEKELVKKSPGEKDADGKVQPDEANSKAVQVVSKQIKFTKEMLSIGQTINGAQLTALKDQNRQAKSICVSLMNYKPKNESAGYYSEGAVGDSALGSIVIK